MISIDRRYLSRAMRKPAFCICENKDADQLQLISVFLFVSSDCNVEEAMIVQYELSVNLENVLRMKMKSFKESFLTNYDQNIEMQILKMGVLILSGTSCMLCEKSCQLLHCCWSMIGLSISRC